MYFDVLVVGLMHTGSNIKKKICVIIQWTFTSAFIYIVRLCIIFFIIKNILVHFLIYNFFYHTFFIIFSLVKPYIKKKTLLNLLYILPSI